MLYDMLMLYDVLTGTIENLQIIGKQGARHLPWWRWRFTISISYGKLKN